MPSLTLTWHVSPGHEHCPLCAEMDGHQWIIQLGVGQFPDVLYYDDKAVWNTLADHSISHEIAEIDWQCYCYLEISDSNFTDLEKELEMLKTAASVYLPTSEIEGLSAQEMEQIE